MLPRIVIALAGGAGLFVSAPASAQFFLKSANLAGARVTGEEPGMIGQPLPGATSDELRAALAWNLRAALNVAALQCEFEPTLLTRVNYNAILKDHAIELANSLSTVEKYFNRTYKNKKQAQVEFDKFGTRVYSGFSTVSGQLSFCQTAASIGHEALFVKRGQFGDLAQDRMRELRASLAPWGEQFRAVMAIEGLPSPRIPAFFADDKCWKKEKYNAKKCGPLAAS